MGEGAGAVVKAVCLKIIIIICISPKALFQHNAVRSAKKSGDRGSVPHSGIQVSKKHIFLPRSFVNIHYCGEPPCLRPSGRARISILCLGVGGGGGWEGAVSSKLFISPCSEEVICLLIIILP